MIGFEIDIEKTLVLIWSMLQEQKNTLDNLVEIVETLTNTSEEYDNDSKYEEVKSEINRELEDLRGRLDQEIKGRIDVLECRTNDLHNQYLSSDIDIRNNLLELKNYLRSIDQRTSGLDLRKEISTFKANLNKYEANFGKLKKYYKELY